MKTRIKWLLPTLFSVLLLAAGQPTQAAGVTDTEIRIGNIMPYTGPLAAFASIGRAEAAYFDMINERGGKQGQDQSSFFYCFHQHGLNAKLNQPCRDYRANLRC